MLELKNVTKKFGKKEILHGIDFKLESGIYGLLGPNGAGKTTLIRCITQLYPLTGGEILFNAKNITNDSDYRNHVGYLPQKFGLFKELTVYEMMSAMAVIKNIDKGAVNREVKRCVELVNLNDKIKDKVKTLSGGMIRRLGIAQAVLGNPELILLDEPTAGLDPEERLRFKNIIARLGDEHTVIISTHIVEDVEAICSNVIVMNDGRIVKSGTCADIQKCAQGKVFALDSTNADKISEPYYLQHQFDRDGVKMLQILTNHPQPDGIVKPVNPNVEDGYLCILKNI